MKLLPFTPSSLNIEVKLEVQTPGFLLSFEVTGGGVDRIALPSRSAKPMRKSELWKQTCFECFFGVGGSKKYFEFNGSPSGDWALYSFDDYRIGMKDIPVDADPSMEKMEASREKIECVWRIPYFTDLVLQSASVTAVIQPEESFWALKHAGKKPDFHLRGSFIHRFI